MLGTEQSGLTKLALTVEPKFVCKKFGQILLHAWHQNSDAGVP